MKTIYIVDFDMLDGKEHTHFVECCKNRKTALVYFNMICEEYKEFWEMFDMIKRHDNYLIAYDEYTHICITMEEKDIKGVK